MESDVLKQLAELRRQYQSYRVSVMVGAGFSKNACPEFPSWNELLYDMVVEMFKDEIEAAYLRFQKLSPFSKMSLEAFTVEEANRIITRIGPLNLVSKYIEQKGFRESIEYYIEERIPYIDEKNSEFRYAGRNSGKRLKINPEHFSAHVKLVQGKRWVQRYTTNYDRLLEYAASSNQKTLMPIIKAKNLSVFRNDPTIIKLHGDLYHPNDKRDFRFDGNPHQQYIISAEDYKAYPKDHEAFTQLMRISLLQGIFCLIGFSGDDPNFVNWIEWVRDILERDESQIGRDEEKDYKIYLVGLSKDLPRLDKQLFYENHNIFFIPILRDDVKQAIGALPTDEIRDVFCHFFDYLEQDDYPQEISGGVEMTTLLSTSGTSSFIKDKSEENDLETSLNSDEGRNLAKQEKFEYQNLWNKVYDVKITGDIRTYSETLTIDEEKLKRLRQIKVWNRFVNYSTQQKHYLKQIHDKKKLTINEARLALLALRDTGIMVDKNLVKIISEAGIAGDDLSELDSLVERSKTLCADWNENDDAPVSMYDKILSCLYDLDFTSAITLARNWTPSGPDVMKKAILLYMFMEEGAVELLSAYLDNEGNAKERYYATKLLNLVENVFPQKHSLAVFENANIQDYVEVLFHNIERVKENKEKIGRYGDGKNEKIIYLNDSKPNKIAESMAVLNFMIDAPALPSYRNFYTFVKAEDWYSVHLNLYERYPFPIMFYDIMCQDRKVRTRIGQDYSYSDHLKDTCLDRILEKMLNALLSDNTPSYLRESIFIISKELFVSVPSTKWDDLFMKIWVNDALGWRFDNKETRLGDVFDSFVYKGFNSLKSTSSRQRIISDVLTRAKKDTGFAINCMYHLHVVKTDGRNQTLSSVVEEFITQLQEPEELTIAGNIYRILTEKQIGKVADKCVKLLNDMKGRSVDKVVYQSAQFFVKDDPIKRKIYIDSVCSSPLLWRNGVTSEGHYTSFTYLNVTNFIRRIYLDKEALLLIYHRLQESLDKLVSFCKKFRMFPALGDIDGLLAEMLSFMNYYQDRLKNQEDFEATYVKAQVTLREVSGVKNLEEGLLSKYDEEVEDALSFIYQNRDTMLHKEIVHYANIVINRVLLRNSDGMDTCVAYLRLYLNENLIRKDDNELMEGLVSVLNRYDKDIAQYCNMNVVMVTRDLSKIGKVLKKYGYSSGGIDYWIGLQASGRFVTNF